jgi:hypothetical protein
MDLELDAKMKKYGLSIAYGILVVAIIGGFIRVEYIAQKIEKETIIRSYNNCIALNEQRDSVLFLANSLREYVRASTDGEESDDERERRDAFIRSIEDNLSEQECPPRPTGSLIEFRVESMMTEAKSSEMLIPEWEQLGIPVVNDAEPIDAEVEHQLVPGDEDGS